jgi:cobalt/nickel transport protein
MPIRPTGAFALAFALACAPVFGALPAWAHFQEILPSADVLPEGGAVSLDLIFTHPMERGPVLEMAKPKRVGLVAAGKTTDLLGQVRGVKIDGKSTWRLDHTLSSPGAAVFFVEPHPYWEAAERTWIIQSAKVVVDGFASGEGWAASTGQPVEIEPLSRPTGLWTGNLFRGLVRAKGKPVPFATVEIEWVNDGSVTPPNEAFVTQVVRADPNGVFAYAMPRAGWWGFAALIDGPAAKGPDGAPARTELGGVIWVKATDMGGRPAAVPPSAPPR